MASLPRVSLNKYKLFGFSDGVLATVYTGDIPTHPVTAELRSPTINIQSASCVCLEYRTFSAFRMYGITDEGTSVVFNHSEIKFNNHDWEVLNVDLPTGRYSLVLESKVGEFSLEAAGFVSGVTYPLLIDNIDIKDGACPVPMQYESMNLPTPVSPDHPQFTGKFVCMIACLFDYLENSTTKLPDACVCLSTTRMSIFLGIHSGPKYEGLAPHDQHMDQRHMTNNQLLKPN